MVMNPKKLSDTRYRSVPVSNKQPTWVLSILQDGYLISEDIIVYIALLRVRFLMEKRMTLFLINLKLLFFQGVNLFR
jgi:hypothetical protein